jgi:predicted nucleotidyltransferase
MHIELPEGSSVYVFGSALSSAQPKDIDILVVYDPMVCSPSRAYAYHEQFLNQLAEMIELPIDITLLSKTEADETRFVESESCVPLEQCCEHGGEQ